MAPPPPPQPQPSDADRALSPHQRESEVSAGGGISTSTSHHHRRQDDELALYEDDRPREASSAMSAPRSSIMSLFGGRANKDPDGSRVVMLADHAANAAAGFCDNSLRSAKYTPWNLIPKALYEQFKRISNSYFLLVAGISFIPGVSPTTPVANVLPLVVVVGFGFARDVYEDVLRARADRKGNSSPQVIVARGTPGGQSNSKRPAGVPLSSARDTSPRARREDSWARIFMKHNLPFELHRKVRSRDIAVGDIVFVTKGDVFPTDMVLLMSSGEGGVAYVSTANLDGESNLKRHVVSTPTSNITDIQELAALRGVLRAQKPDLALHRFEGSIRLADTNVTAPLDSSNLLLRGSILRNTDFIYGVAVYTGSDTKVALNMRNPPSKMGQTERKLNWVVLFLFANLSALVIIAACVSGFLQGKYGAGQWYMGALRLLKGSKVTVNGLATFLVLFSTYIPVSLFVTLEFVRVVQAVFMQVDAKMKTKGQAVTVKATNLNEVLGQIQFILSDKTGTLTENIMRYVACSAGGKLYDTSKSARVMKRAIASRVTPVCDLILAMALCHSVVPEPKDEEVVENEAKERAQASANAARDQATGTDTEGAPKGDDAATNGMPFETLPEYQGQSPDEVALVASAREYGVTLLHRTLDTMVVDNFGTEEKYTALAELEFNSDRKRMSIIFRCPDKSIRMYTKGADTIMMPLLKASPENATTQEHIDEFAKEGLRTLVFATKQLSEHDFNAWFKDFQEARNLLTGRDEAVSEVGARLEQNLDYVAVTAVEDKLQDRVPETIKFFREAGVGLWVLTGDKRETAENIGYSANLLDKKMNVVHIQASTADELTAQLTDAKRKYVDDGPVSGRLSMTRNRSSEAKRHAPLLGAQGSGEHGHGSRGVDSLDGQNDGDLTQPSAMRRVSSKLGDGMRSLSSALSFGEKRKFADAELGLVIDGASLAHAIESHPDQFMALADRCKTIICCRVTPLQKALVVRMVREMRKALTLAVGDGGNDVSMIQEAHVGVGIFGKEGTQAARASDYAISEFKHLQRLLSIHGRFSYVRTAGMINLSFYKNIFFTLTQVLFQIYNFDTGTTFQDQWIVSAFNVIVTAAPPFLFGIFERDLEESTVTRFPGVYSSNRGDRLFSLRTVIEFTLLYGLWHCICVFFGVFFGLGYLTIPFKNGKDGGLFFTAFGSSVMIVIIALSKFILHSHVLNWIILLLLALSFAAFFGLVPLAIYAVQEYPLEGQLLMLFSSPQFYLTCALVIAAAFVVDFVVLVTRQLMFPNVVGTLQRWEQNHGQSKESQA